MTRALMLQGTGSDVGKSVLLAGLARAYTRRGLAVRPFKPQNMANNAAVTADGGEIGRAQALQARACGVPPAIDMNPVLLKPQAEAGSQVVVHGEVRGSLSARAYHSERAALLDPVLESFHRLTGDADLVLVEGAGGAAEMNLRPGDIANMGFARAANVPVALIGDVDRGGVLASIVGTHALLDGGDRALLAGYIINRLRGDPALFDSALPIMSDHTGLSCLGVVPHMPEAARLPAEDSVALERPRGGEGGGGTVKIAVPRLARIANFDDLDPLAAEPDVTVAVVPPEQPLPLDADLVLLPGSKATRADLAMLFDTAWATDLRALARQGVPVLGLCGGYQMLGRTVADPDGIEGEPGTTEGLGLLAVETVLTGDKTLRPARGTALGAPVAGYEMHVGRTTGPDTARPLVIGGGDGGATSPDGRVMGAYLHGLFTDDAFRRAFLDRLGVGVFAEQAHEAGVEAALDAIARRLEGALDLDALWRTAGEVDG